MSFAVNVYSCLSLHVTPPHDKNLQLFLRPGARAHDRRLYISFNSRKYEPKMKLLVSP